MRDAAFVRVGKSKFALRALVGDSPNEAADKPIEHDSAPSQAEKVQTDGLPNGNADISIAPPQPVQDKAQQAPLSPPKKRKKPDETVAEDEPHEPPPLLSIEASHTPKS